VIGQGLEPSPQVTAKATIAACHYKLARLNRTITARRYRTETTL
jgi:hypothetical protein